MQECGLILSGINRHSDIRGTLMWRGAGEVGQGGGSWTMCDWTMTRDRVSHSHLLWCSLCVWTQQCGDFWWTSQEVVLHYCCRKLGKNACLRSRHKKEWKERNWRQSRSYFSLSFAANGEQRNEAVTGWGEELGKSQERFLEGERNNSIFISSWECSTREGKIGDDGD